MKYEKPILMPISERSSMVCAIGNSATHEMTCTTGPTVPPIGNPECGVGNSNLMNCLNGNQAGRDACYGGAGVKGACITGGNPNG